MVLGTMLKSTKVTFHMFPGIVASVIVLIYVSTKLTGIFEYINDISVRAGIKSEYINIILKCIGICYLGDFATSLCKDSGENTLAYNAELLCKCSIVVVALPVYSEILNIIMKLWESI